MTAQEREHEESRLKRKGDEEGEAEREEELRNWTCETQQGHIPDHGNVQWTVESRGVTYLMVNCSPCAISCHSTTLKASEKILLTCLEMEIHWGNLGQESVFYLWNNRWIKGNQQRR